MSALRDCRRGPRRWIKANPAASRSRISRIGRRAAALMKGYRVSSAKAVSPWKEITAALRESAVEWNFILMEQEGSGFRNLKPRNAV